MKLEEYEARQARVRELLRSSAALIDGSSPLYGRSEPAVRAEHARKLRELAGESCIHIRICGDGTCRYCGLQIVSGDEGDS